MLFLIVQLSKCSARSRLEEVTQIRDTIQSTVDLDASAPLSTRGRPLWPRYSETILELSPSMVLHFLHWCVERSKKKSLKVCAQLEGGLLVYLQNRLLLKSGVWCWKQHAVLGETARHLSKPRGRDGREKKSREHEDLNIHRR